MKPAGYGAQTQREMLAKAATPAGMHSPDGLVFRAWLKQARALVDEIESFEKGDGANRDSVRKALNALTHWQKAVHGRLVAILSRSDPSPRGVRVEKRFAPPEPMPAPSPEEANSVSFDATDYWWEDRSGKRTVRLSSRVLAQLSMIPDEQTRDALTAMILSEAANGP